MDFRSNWTGVVASCETLAMLYTYKIASPFFSSIGIDVFQKNMSPVQNGSHPLTPGSPLGRAHPHHP